jgi:hypothetical protein
VSQMKHTPGGWKAVKLTRTKLSMYRIDTSRNQTIANIFTNLDEGITEVQTEANARLIASAPELLDLCTELRNCLVDYFDKSVLKNTPQIKRALENYRIITAKVEGR